jgi:hypothetical protein
MSAITEMPGLLNRTSISAATRPHLATGRPTDLSDGAVIERLGRMRAACHALAVELASARRELRSVEAELRRVKRRHGETA